MTLQLTLTQDEESKLRQRAEAAGQELSNYVLNMIRQFGAPPTPIEELSGSIYGNFLASGMTDDELADELERAKHEMRADRRSRHAS